jgi:PAS domain S-box-containing protein
MCRSIKMTADETKDRVENFTPRERRRIRNEMRQQGKDQRPPTRFLFWGLMLILAGVIAFFYEQNQLAADDIWKAFISGLGGIFIIQSIAYTFSSAYRQNAIGRLIPGLILLFVGLALLFGFNVWWPLALVIAGVIVLLISWFLQREITKRKITQETLRESEVKYRHIIDNANSVIMEVDARGNITFINKYALDFFGFQEEEILGHNVVGTIIALTAEAAAEQDTMIKDIVTSSESYRLNEKENLRKNGEKVWMLWTYKPILDEGNNLKEILCTGIDRTQQKKAEELAAQQIKEQTTAEERTRLARDLHDAVSQTLFSTSLIAEVLPKLWERNKEDGLKKLEEVRQLTRGALAEMRTLLFELRPAALSNADLKELLRQLAESVTGRARVPVTLDINGDCDVPTDVKITLYRIAQEALNNIAKHSGASRAQVTLDCQPDRITLQVIDNGRGFDISRVAAGSFGLNNMQERAGDIGAALQINSTINEGTEVTVTWSRAAVEVVK